MEKVTSKNSPFRLHSQGAHNLNKRQEEKKPSFTFSAQKLKESRKKNSLFCLCRTFICPCLDSYKRREKVECSHRHLVCEKKAPSFCHIAKRGRRAGAAVLHQKTFFFFLLLLKSYNTNSSRFLPRPLEPSLSNFHLALKSRARRKSKMHGHLVWVIGHDKVQPFLPTTVSLVYFSPCLFPKPHF